jgi:hypothetical protein
MFTYKKRMFKHKLKYHNGYIIKKIIAQHVKNIQIMSIMNYNIVVFKVVQVDHLIHFD